MATERGPSVDEILDDMEGGTLVNYTRDNLRAAAARERDEAYRRGLEASAKVAEATAKKRDLVSLGEKPIPVPGWNGWPSDRMFIACMTATRAIRALEVPGKRK